LLFVLISTRSSITISLVSTTVIGGELSQSKIVYMFRETSYLVFDNKNCYFHFSLKRLFIIFIFIMSSVFLKYVEILLFFDFYAIQI
jgi:hypothetical protein